MLFCDSVAFYCFLLQLLLAPQRYATALLYQVQRRIRSGQASFWHRGGGSIEEFQGGHNIGASIIRIGFRVYYTISIIRNPPKSLSSEPRNLGRRCRTPRDIPVDTLNEWHQEFGAMMQSVSRIIDKLRAQEGATVTLRLFARPDVQSASPPKPHSNY